MVRRKIEPPRGVLKTTAGEVPGLVHERFLPSGDLAAHVEHYWLVSWDFRGRQPHPVATLPHPTLPPARDG